MTSSQPSSPHRTLRTAVEQIVDKVDGEKRQAAWLQTEVRFECDDVDRCQLTALELAVDIGIELKKFLARCADEGCAFLAQCEGKPCAPRALLA